MSRFFLEKLLLKILQEKTNRDMDGFWEINRYVQVFDKAEEFYNKLSNDELDDLVKKN